MTPRAERRRVVRIPGASPNGHVDSAPVEIEDPAMLGTFAEVLVQIPVTQQIINAFVVGRGLTDGTWNLEITGARLVRKPTEET